MVDERTVETIKIDAGMLNGTDLGVFMSNSFEDAENMQKLERYLDVALQTDKANLSDVITILGSKSLSLIEDTIVAGERDKANRESEAAKAQSTLDDPSQAGYNIKMADQTPGLEGPASSYTYTVMNVGMQGGPTLSTQNKACWGRSCATAPACSTASRVSAADLYRDDHRRIFTPSRQVL